MSAPPADLLAADTALQALRMLRADEAPYPGGLHAEGDASDGDPAHTVWVDAELIPPALWRADGHGHLLVPLDLARTATGHAAVLPHCPVRLDGIVAAGPHPGEAVTIAVSMLRGGVEARRAAIETGGWWVDATGRPVLAAGGSARWEDGSVELIAGLADAAPPALRDALEDAARLLSTGHAGAEEIAECEDALFRAADPMPLTSGRRPDGSASALLPRRVQTLTHQVEPSPGEAWLARFTDTVWAARVGAALRSVARVPRTAVARAHERADARRGGNRGEQTSGSHPLSARRGRRAPWLVAAAVGGIVVIGGVMWPSDDTTPAASAPRAEASAAASATPPNPTPPPDPTQPTAPVDVDDADGADGAGAAAGAAMAALAACVADGATTCPAVLEDPSASVPAGIVSSSGAAPTATLVDEYGGVAVYRIEAPDEPSQILVLVSVDGKWLVRDVYDVADQP